MQAHVVALVVDGNEPLTKQDLALAQKAIDEGRCILVVLNKMDRVENKKAVEDGVVDRLASAVWEAQGTQCVSVSALTGQGVENIMPAVYVSAVAATRLPKVMHVVHVTSSCVLMCVEQYERPCQLECQSGDTGAEYVSFRSTVCGGFGTGA